MNKLTNAEKVRLNLICNIQQMKKEGYSISEISRLLGKDRRTIKRYITGSPNDLCKNIRAKRYNPYENRVISLVKNGYIEKQIVDILMLEGYKLTVSSARHMIQRVVKANKLKINKYSPVLNSIKTPKGASDIKYTYLKRSYIFEYLWMNCNISKFEKDFICKNYPNILILKKCINEFRELFSKKSLTLLYVFIDKYKDINIPEIKSFTKGLLKDLEAIENAVSSDLSNGFVEGTNSKLKMIKRTMYGRCGKRLLAAKLMLSLNG